MATTKEQAEAARRMLGHVTEAAHALDRGEVGVALDELHAAQEQAYLAGLEPIAPAGAIKL